MMPRSSMTIIASGTVSRIDCRCASRASASRVIILVPRWLRCRSSPPHDTPMPMMANAAKLMNVADVTGGASAIRNELAMLNAVANSPGPRPPIHAATSTEGTK